MNLEIQSLSQNGSSHEKKLGFSKQIKSSQDKHEKFTYILYHLAIEVFFVQEEELISDLSKYQLRLENWKPLFYNSKEESDESLRNDCKDALQKLNAIRPKVENWAEEIKKISASIENSPVQQNIYLKDLAIIQLEYDNLCEKNRGFLDDGIETILSKLDVRISLDNNHTISRESADLIVRCYDISIEEFDEHLQYFHKNTIFFKVSKETIEALNEKLHGNHSKSIQGLFSSFQQNFNDLYKRIAAPEIPQGSFTYYKDKAYNYLHGIKDDSDPLHDTDIKIQHQVDLKISNEVEKSVKNNVVLLTAEANIIDIRGSTIYKSIKSLSANEVVSNLKYTDLVVFMTAVASFDSKINLLGPHENKIEIYNQTYQQILKWEKMPRLLKIESHRALADKAQDLLNKMAYLVKNAQQWSKGIDDLNKNDDFIITDLENIENNQLSIELMQSINPDLKKLGLLRSIQIFIITDLEKNECDQFDVDLLQSRDPVLKKLGILRNIQIAFSKLSLECFQPFLDQFALVSKELLESIALMDKDSISDKAIELIAAAFEITAPKVHQRREDLKTSYKKLQEEHTKLTKEYQTMCTIVEKFKKDFNECLVGIIQPDGGFDAWIQGLTTSPVDTPNFLEIDKVQDFLTIHRKKDV